MDRIIQQVNQLLCRSNSPSLLQQLEPSTTTTQPAIEQTTPMASQSCTPSAAPVPSSASNDSDTDKSNNGSFEIISDTELVLQDNQPQEQINVQIVEETVQYNKQQINQQIIQAEQQQASNSPPLKPILKQSTDDSSDTDDNFDTVDMYGGDVNRENMDVNLPAVVEQTTPIISHPCMPPAVPAPCSTNNDSDVDSYSDLDDIYNIDDIYDGIMDDMYDGNVNLENMDVNSTVVEQITPITSHPCMPPAVPTPSSTDNNFDTNSKSDTDNNYGGNVNLENMDVNSQDAQQSLPQSKLISKQLNLILKQLNSILNPSTANTQPTVEQTTSTISQLCMPPAVFALSSTNNDSNTDSYSDTDDNYGGNVDFENMDVNSQDAQSLPQLKLILKQLDSTLKQLNSILNPSTASTQPTIEQTTSISSQPCMPPPILAPNVANNNSNMNVNPEKIDIDFEDVQLRLQKKQCNFICNRLHRLQVKLTKPIQPKDAYMVLCTIKAKTLYGWDSEEIKFETLTKSSFTAHVKCNGKHYYGKGLSKSLARQDIAEKILKDVFFDKMVTKSKTCTFGQSDTQAANSSVDENKEKIDAQNAIVMSAKDEISWSVLANFALYKLILDWNNERTSNSIVENIKTRNEVCQETIKNLQICNPIKNLVQLLNHMHPNLIYIVNRINKVPHEIFTITTKINGMEFSGTAAKIKDAKIKLAKQALLKLYNVDYAI